MKKSDVLLVGIGGYGEVYVKDILENSHDMINLIGVVDPYPERCKYYDELKRKDIPIYSTMDTFFENYSVDLTVISTPIFLHTEHIIKALKNKSNVLCEKPLCADECDIELIRSAQEECGKFVYIGYQWCYSEAIINLKNDILNNKFGELIEMKALVLRPRNLDYFKRGVGWAGKIKMPDGRPVYDSVANNAAAHYLYNMIHLTDNENLRAEPENISAELLRANEIENFDASKINFTINNKKICFIAAHPVERNIEAMFEYRFTNGTIYYTRSELGDNSDLIPKEYTEYGNVVAIMKDGEKIIYGNPLENICRKLHIAASDAANNVNKEPICGVESTAIHTRLINKIQKGFDIHNVKKDLTTIENNSLYVRGLFEKAIECYKNTENSLSEFME